MYFFFTVKMKPLYGIYFSAELICTDLTSHMFVLLPGTLNCGYTIYFRIPWTVCWEGTSSSYVLWWSSLNVAGLCSRCWNGIK